MRLRIVVPAILIMCMAGIGFATGTTEADGAQPSVAPGPFGRYSETVVLQYGKTINPTEQLGPGETHEDNQFTRHILDVLNVDARSFWQVSSGDADQRINLAIASNDLPDALVVNSTQLYQMVRADQIADLTDAYDEYVSPALHWMMDKAQSQVDAAVRFDGRMMALPSLNVPDDSYHMIWVRQDWLDRLGLEPPRTVADVERIARAFIEDDPDGNGVDDTIGLSGPQSGAALYGDFMNPNNITMGFDPIFAGFNSFPGFWIEGPEGEITYGSILPETRSALARLAQMYEDGLIDPEMGLRANDKEPIVAGTGGLFSGVWWMGYWPFPDAWANNPDADFRAYPIYADDGNAYFHMGTPANSFIVVNKDYPYPEAAVKIANVNLRDENEFDLDLGSVGNMVLHAPVGAYDETGVTRDALRDLMVDGTGVDEYSDDFFAVYKLLRNDMLTLPLVKEEPFDDLSISTWDLDADSNSYRLWSVLVGADPIYDPDVARTEVYSAVYSQTATMLSRWENLSRLEEETFLKIILGVEDVSAFDDFVEDWLSQGGAQITDEVRAAAQ